jgi:hypothetical protein
MVEISKQLNFSQSSQAEHGVFKWLDAFYGDGLASWLVQSRTIEQKGQCQLLSFDKQSAFLPSHYQNKLSLFHLFDQASRLNLCHLSESSSCWDQLAHLLRHRPRLNNKKLLTIRHHRLLHLLYLQLHIDLRH